MPARGAKPQQYRPAMDTFLRNCTAKDLRSVIHQHPARAKLYKKGDPSALKLARALVTFFVPLCTETEIEFKNLSDILNTWKNKRTFVNVKVRAGTIRDYRGVVGPVLRMLTEESTCRVERDSVVAEVKAHATTLATNMSSFITVGLTELVTPILIGISWMARELDTGRTVIPKLILNSTALWALFHTARALQFRSTDRPSFTSKNLFESNARFKAGHSWKLSQWVTGVNPTPVDPPARARANSRVQLYGKKRGGAIDTNNLKEHSFLLLRNWCPPELYLACLQWLKGAEWTDRKHGRASTFTAETNKYSYKWSNIRATANPARAIGALALQINEATGIAFNVANGMRYANRTAKLGAHYDDEKSHSKLHPWLGSMSFGNTCQFRLFIKPNPITLRLHKGDLMLFDRRLKHSVVSCKGQRYNLTFRLFEPPRTPKGRTAIVRVPWYKGVLFGHEQCEKPKIKPAGQAKKRKPFMVIAPTNHEPRLLVEVPQQPDDSGSTPRAPLSSGPRISDSSVTRQPKVANRKERERPESDEKLKTKPAKEVKKHQTFIVIAPAASEPLIIADEPRHADDSGSIPSAPLSSRPILIDPTITNHQPRNQGNNTTSVAPSPEATDATDTTEHKIRTIVISDDEFSLLSSLSEDSDPSQEDPESDTESPAKRRRLQSRQSSPSSVSSDTPKKPKRTRAKHKKKRRSKNRTPERSASEESSSGEYERRSKQAPPRRRLQVVKASAQTVVPTRDSLQRPRTTFRDVVTATLNTGQELAARARHTAHEGGGATPKRPGRAALRRQEKGHGAVPKGPGRAALRRQRRNNATVNVVPDTTPTVFFRLWTNPTDVNTKPAPTGPQPGHTPCPALGTPQELAATEGRPGPSAVNTAPITPPLTPPLPHIPPGHPESQAEHTPCPAPVKVPELAMRTGQSIPFYNRTTPVGDGTSAPPSSEPKPKLP